jgi:2-keto-4-pentenoate hydratase
VSHPSSQEPTPAAASGSATHGPGRATAEVADLYRQAAGRLLDAARHRTPCAPVRDLLGATDMDAGYAVQRLLTQHAVAEGRHMVGRKIGLTAEAVQRQLGVDRPDFGVLFADMARTETEPIGMTALLQPKIEAEVAFVLGNDLDSAELDLDAVRSSVDYVVAALEIVDSRVANWDISLVDTVADNASCGLYVLGAERLPLTGADLPAVTMSMTADGKVVSEGTGAACLGDPCAALLWLARTVRQYGSPLRAGEVVLSGALGPMVPVTPGTTYVATIEGLGTVRTSFVEDIS